MLCHSTALLNPKRRVAGVDLVSGEAKQNHKGSLNPVPETLKPRVEVDPLKGALIIRHHVAHFSSPFFCGSPNDLRHGLETTISATITLPQPITFSALLLSRPGM